MIDQKTKQCYFCAANYKAIGHQDPKLLRKFMTPQAQIMKRRRTGICALHQRKLARAIKRGRQLGTVPFVTR